MRFSHNKFLSSLTALFAILALLLSVSFTPLFVSSPSSLAMASDVLSIFLGFHPAILYINNASASLLFDGKLFSGGFSDTPVGKLFDLYWFSDDYNYITNLSFLLSGSSPLSPYEYSLFQLDTTSNSYKLITSRHWHALV